MTREEAAKRFAEVMWPNDPLRVTVDERGDIEAFDFVEESPNLTPFPAPNAPLHEHLAFVGRVTTACGRIVLGEFALTVRLENGSVEWRVWISFAARGQAPDLSHAALLAGIAAKEPR